MMVVEHDCEMNGQRVVSLINYSEDGVQLGTPDAADTGFKANAPSSIGTRIGRALCAETQQWGNAVPAQQAPHGETATSFAGRVFSSRWIVGPELTISEGLVQPNGDSLLPLRKGMMACYRPNLNAKRCDTIESYEFQSDGTVKVHATVAEAPSRTAAMKITYQANLRDNVLCGGPTEDDLRMATFWTDGVLMSAAQATQYREQHKLMRPVIEAQGEQCVRFSQFYYGVWAQVTTGGTYRPVLDAPVVWISPDAEFDVRP